METVDDLVERNLGLVYFCAGRFRASGMEPEDLVQEGVLGLMEAARRFDPARGFQFSTYAMWYIRKTIVEAIRDKNDMIRTPRRRPAIPCGSIDRGRIPELVDEAPTALDRLVLDDERARMRWCVCLLPERERFVLARRHGIGSDSMTLQKVSEILGLTGERVRQIQLQAEENLRQIVLACATLQSIRRGDSPADPKGNQKQT